MLDCQRQGVVIAGKPTSWGAWEYWVCAHHKAQVDDGADIRDLPDGRTITLVPVAPAATSPVMPETTGH